MLAIRDLNVRFQGGDESVRSELEIRIAELRQSLGAKSDAFHHVNDMARAMGEFMTNRLVATGTSVLSGYLSAMRGLDTLQTQLDHRSPKT